MTAPADLAAPAANSGTAQIGGDERIRVRLGAAADTAQAVLLRLATDPAPTVRAAVAMNPAASGAVNQVLAGDGDARIRALLARKLAAILPAMPIAARDRMQAQALATLESLVADEAVRVRMAIADAIKDLPGVPHGMVIALARDAAMQVAEPVIRLSPLLSDDDLLALIAAPPVAATLNAVASRPGIAPAITQALAASDHADAITAMLENPTAAIQEATLDALVGRARAHTAWHAPIVRRPHLSSHAARALSLFVAEHLLDELAQRADLDAATSAELRRRVGSSLAASRAPQAPTDLHQAMAQARCMFADGALDDLAVLAAVERGEAVLATALLAVATDLPYAAVDRAVTLRSPKAIVALVWKANFGMALAVALQSMLLGAAPHTLLQAAPRGGFPLAVDEMRFQLDFLAKMGR